QGVDVGIAAVNVGAALGDESLEARRGIAVRAARGQHDVLQALVRIRAVERRPLERPQLGADAYFAKIVEYRLGVLGEGQVAVKVAGVEAVGVARIRQQLLGSDRVVGRGRRGPEVVEAFRNDAA